jgi:hypothetical protein
MNSRGLSNRRRYTNCQTFSIVTSFQIGLKERAFHLQTCVQSQVSLFLTKSPIRQFFAGNLSHPRKSALFYLNHTHLTSLCLARNKTEQWNTVSMMNRTLNSLLLEWLRKLELKLNRGKPLFISKAEFDSSFPSLWINSPKRIHELWDLTNHHWTVECGGEELKTKKHRESNLNWIVQSHKIERIDRIEWDNMVYFLQSGISVTKKLVSYT